MFTITSHKLCPSACMWSVLCCLSWLLVTVIQAHLHLNLFPCFIKLDHVWLNTSWEREPCMYGRAQHCWAFTLACECTGSNHHIYSLPSPVVCLMPFILFTPNQGCILDILVHFSLKRAQNHSRRRLPQHRIYSRDWWGKYTEGVYTCHQGWC